MPSEGPQSHYLPIEYVVSEGVATRLATNMTVQADVGGVYLSFYESVPPLFLGTPDQVQEKLAKIGAVKAECFARIFIPGPRLAEFLDALKPLKDVVWTSPNLTKPEASQPEGPEL